LRGGGNIEVSSPSGGTMAGCRCVIPKTKQPRSIEIRHPGSCLRELIGAGSPGRLIDLCHDAGPPLTKPVLGLAEKMPVKSKLSSGDVEMTLPLTVTSVLPLA
jgi:hypothetical protein